MNPHKYLPAMVVGALGLVAITVSATTKNGPSGPVMVTACVAGPLAVLLAIRARLGSPRMPVRAIVGGATVGPLIAIATHGAVAAFAAAFFLGFLESGHRLLLELLVNPKLASILGSPWFTLLLVDLVVVAPLTEETGKYLGARIARPATRREAFLAGAAAGTGFAIVENLLYVSLAVAFGGPWTVVIVARAMGVAVHPLATGLVARGWWDHRHGVPGAATRGFFSGVGIHALWNGIVIVLGIAATTAALGSGPVAPEIVELAFAAALGVVMAAALWATTSRVAVGTHERGSRRASSAAAWIVLASTIVIPVAVLVISYPGFARG